jgi:hypothetical protein
MDRDLIAGLLEIDVDEINITPESCRELWKDDFPIVFDGDNLSGEAVIASFAEEPEDGSYDYFFLAKPIQEDLESFFSGDITLRELYFRQDIMYIGRGVGTKMYKAYEIKPCNVPQSHMPTENSFLPYKVRFLRSLDESGEKETK